MKVITKSRKLSISGYIFAFILYLSNKLGSCGNCTLHCTVTTIQSVSEDACCPLYNKSNWHVMFYTRKLSLLLCYQISNITVLMHYNYSCTWGTKGEFLKPDIKTRESWWLQIQQVIWQHDKYCNLRLYICISGLNLFTEDVQRNQLFPQKNHCDMEKHDKTVSRIWI